MSPKYEELVGKLRPVCLLPSDDKVIESALLLLAWAVVHVRKGHAIAAVDHDVMTFAEVEIPALRAVKACA